MNFQIKQLILWPKNTAYQYKTVDFELGKVNVITGASRTGKSAIIPIIDYCLASGECYIPVKTIRNACSWFGILLQVDKRQILLARREPERQKSTDDMFMLEDIQVSIPDIPIKNTNAPAVKKFLDILSNLSFLELDAETDNNFLNRPSFRDMMAFCFQPQNIVANANTLFYKADTSEHRTKLINILPYVLGAVTPEILAKRQEINRLERELLRKQREFDRIKDVAEKWRSELNGWLSVASEYGLVSKEIVSTMTFEDQVDILASLSHKNVSDANVLGENIELSSQEIVALKKEENNLSLKLSMYKNRYTEMTQLMASVEDYRQSLSVQIERLNVSKWLHSLTDGEKSCPICGGRSAYSTIQIDSLYTNLVALEEEAGDMNRVPAAFEREFENVKTEMEKLTSQITAIQKRIQIQNKILNSSQDEKYTIEGISRFLGQAEYASETFRKIGEDSELLEEIEKLQKRLQKLRTQVNEFAIKQKMEAALRLIETNAIKLIPLLDSERPNDPVKFDYKNLTIVVTGEDGRDDYLWEIGSGSNWLAYHISMTLALQQFFIRSGTSPVPSFIVYDQPSQVYFPKKLAAKSEEEIDLDPQYQKDEDKIAVRKIFSTMSTAQKEMNNQMQIIVLEHADESVWGDVENIYEVCEWRGINNKLIPEEWIER